MPDREKIYVVKFDTQKAKASYDGLERHVDKAEREMGRATKRAAKEREARIKKMAKEITRQNKWIAKETVKSEKWATAQVKKAARERERALKKAAREATAASKQRMKALSGGLQGFSRNWNRYVTLPVLAGGAASLKFSKDFNAGMANVATLIPGNTERVMELRQQILKMSVESGKSLDDLTDGLYETVSAYGDSEETVKRLDVATKAAIGGRAQTLDAVKLLSAVTKGYGDVSGEAAQKASDLAFMTVKMGQTTFPELAASMGKVIPLAAQMETKQEELFGAYATLTGVTGNASEVTTQLASVYRAFLKPTEKLTKLSKKYGHETAQAMLKARGLAETIKILGKETKGNEEALLKMLRRGEALVGVLPLIGNQADVYTEKTEAMAEATGATIEAFKEQTEGVNAAGHQFEQTKRRAIAFAVRIGDKLLPMAGRFMDRLEPWLEMMEDLDEATMDQILSIGKWVTIIGVASKAVSGLTTLFGPLITKYAAANAGAATLNTTMSAAPGKIGATAKALGGLNAALGVAGAALAGYGVGTMLHETVFDPAAKRDEKRREQAHEAAFQARQVLGGKAPDTISGLKNEIAKIEKTQAQVREARARSAGEGANLEYAAGHVVSLFTGEKSPSQLKAEREKGLAAQAQQLQQRRLERMRMLGAKEVAAVERGGGGSNVTVGSTNITVNANGGADDIARKVKREVDKSNKRLEKSLKKRARSASPLEQ